MGINNPSGGGLWEKLHDETLAAAGRFDVSSISANFSSLEIRLFGRTDFASTGQQISMHFNADTTDANYRNQIIQATAAVVSSSSGDAPTIGSVPAATATANYFGVVYISILDYTNSLTKTAIAYEGHRRAATTEFVRDTMMHWESTAVINQITIEPINYSTNEFVAGSRLVVYGVT